LGGLVTSQFALADGSHEIGLALAGLIALPCAVLAFKNKWHDLAWVLWGSVQLSLMALHYGAQDLVLSTIGIYGSGILVLLIFAARFEYWEADDSSVSIPSLAVLTAGLPLMIWAVIPPETTALHNAIFGAILVGGSYALRADVAKRRVLLGGVLVLTVVGPLGLDPQVGLYTFAGLAICSSLLSKFVFKPDGSARMPALWLATVQTTAAIVMYLVAISDGAPDRWTDAAMLGAIGAALASTIWPMSPQDKVQKLVIGLGALAGWPIVVGIASRLLYAGARLEPELLVIPNAMYALLVVGIGWRIQQGFLVGIGAFFTFVTCFMGLVVGVPSDFELPIWFGLNLLALATVFALMKTLKERTTVGTVSAVFMWPVVTKLLMALLSGQFGIDSGAALTISWVLYGGALIQLGFSFDEKPLRIFSLVVFGITLGKVVLVDMADLDPMIRVGTTALLGLALIGGGHMYVRSRKR
jgi:hypothetical protein